MDKISIQVESPKNAGITRVRLDGWANAHLCSYNNLQVKPGLECIVESDRGLEFGLIQNLCCPHLSKKQEGEEYPRILRLSTDSDKNVRIEQRQKEKEAERYARDKINDYNLKMKLTNVYMLFDGSKIIFYYTADARVDFRDLVKDLASQLHSRIEMRQIGVRDEAKMNGGYGHCGMPLCCSAHLKCFYPVSVKMAKDQGVSLNPTKISGVCGRLMCCLRYELTQIDNNIQNGE